MQTVNEAPFLTSYAGIRCQQNVHAFTAFRSLFSSESFDVIIELGAASGSFSQFLAAEQTGRVVSWDLYVPKWPPRERLEYRAGDVLSAEVMAANKELIDAAPRRAMILCDNGAKPVEFIAYSAMLRPGDVIMVHDYAKSRQVFQAVMKDRYWNWLECMEEHIASAIKTFGLQPYHEPMFSIAAWGSFWRPGT